MTAAGNGQRPHLDGEDRRPGDRSGGLPLPGHERWQPLRAGLVDLFLYDDEEFRFRDGHLLLRGNNGNGKSKVLALMLPFLLDGELAPHRVEPDADPGKRMEWNLLLGGRYQERLGYTWLELGRLAEDGSPAYLTLGCGLKAVAGRGIAARWFFVTTRRVWTCASSARWAPRSSVTGSSRRWAIPAGSSTTPRRTGERSTSTCSTSAPSVTTHWSTC